MNKISKIYCHYYYYFKNHNTRSLFKVLNEENYTNFLFELLVIPDSKKVKLDNGEEISVNSCEFYGDTLISS